MGIWDQLTTRTLFGSARATAAQVNSQEKDIHLEEKNRALLADVNLINTSLMRSDAAPIPNTLTVEQIVSNDSGTGFNNDFVQAGEVWQVYGFAIAAMTGRSGAVVHEVYIVDKTNERAVEIIDVSASSSQLPLLEAQYSPIYIDENAFIRYEATGTFTDSTLYFICVRVR